MKICGIKWSQNSAFYHKDLLPKLAAPRLSTTFSGIRELGILCKRYKETQSNCKRGSEVTTTVKQDNCHQSVKHFDSRVNPSPFSSTLKAEVKFSNAAKLTFVDRDRAQDKTGPKDCYKFDLKVVEFYISG
ncbi:hypothetical protein KUTeg_001658 [Tegillarca granosa]|uniref:Uncharacterized protein n=1 Tax=Tegillarca granosa TaxID=220873 RepID=A0ABQ9FTJ6_TEGGR|nr:hypothetical protein KUTeg_001658 [Tegillarca granosa]